jgi:hypothetical protein
MLAVVIMFRILFVKHEIVFVAKMGCISVILYFIFSAIAVQINSLVGICIGYNITWLFLFIFSLRKILTINSIDQESVLYTFKLILNLLITGGILYFLKINLFIYLNSLYIINYLLILFISFILGCTIFFTLSFFLKQKEILFLIRNLYNVVSNKKVNAL